MPVGIEANPYDGRHSYASLLIHAGRSPLAVAAAMRHASAEITWKHYAHLFEEAQLASSSDPEEAIWAARRKVSKGWAASNHRDRPPRGEDLPRARRSVTGAPCTIPGDPSSSGGASARAAGGHVASTWLYASMAQSDGNGSLSSPGPRTVEAAEPLLSVQQCAALLAVNHKTVRRLITSGALPALRVGRVLRIRPDDLELLSHRPSRIAVTQPARPRPPGGEFARRARAARQ